MKRAATTLTVRSSSQLRDFVAANVGESGNHENVSEYIRDLIRRNKERSEVEAFERLGAELQPAFSAPYDTYRPLTAAEAIERHKRSSA